MDPRRAVTADELLDEAGARGVKLRARGNRLALDGPEAAVSELRPALLAAKPALLSLLRARAWSIPAPGRVPVPGSPYRCHACWRRFPEVQLTVVDEPLGRGFRCARCLRDGHPGGPAGSEVRLDAGSRPAVSSHEEPES